MVQLMTNETCSTPLFIQFKDGTLAPIDADQVERYGLKVGMVTTYGVVVESPSIIVEEVVEVANPFRGGAKDSRTRLVAYKMHMDKDYTCSETFCRNCTKAICLISRNKDLDAQFCCNVDVDNQVMVAQAMGRTEGHAYISTENRETLMELLQVN